MSMQSKSRRPRNATATLRAVAAAPAVKTSRKQGPTAKRFKLRRGLVAALFASVLAIGVVGAPKVSRADFNPTPEIDPGSMAGALTMLVGGFLALTDRARRSA